MNNEFFTQIRTYYEALSLLRQMMEAGLISQKEFQTIEVRLAEKYNLPQGSILRELS